MRRRRWIVAYGTNGMAGEQMGFVQDAEVVSRVVENKSIGRVKRRVSRRLSNPILSSREETGMALPRLGHSNADMGAYPCHQDV